MKTVLNEKVIYNPQIDNQAVQHISGGSQCGYTACGMVASIMNPFYGTDEWIKYLVGEMETEKGIFYKAIKKKYPGLYGRLGARGESYHAVFLELIQLYSHKFKAGFLPTGGTLKDIKNIINNGGAVLLSTMLAPSGHYIAVVGYKENDNGNIMSLICYDPAGDQRKGYFNAYGENVEYPIPTMNEKFTASSPDGKSYRFSYVIPE